MTISKRVRFEILRRDNHTCMYCGRIAPDVALQVDHVVPVSLGGSDDPGNLVSACVDCNSGKASVPPNSPLVQQVSDHAAAYALGMLDKLTQLRADLEREKAWEAEFLDQWTVWGYTDKTSGERRPIPLSARWQQSVVRWKAMGVPALLFEKAIRIAMEKRDLKGGQGVEFAYMAGVIWNTINALEVDYDLKPEHAVAYTQKDLSERAVAAYDRGYETGFHDGGNGRDTLLENQDIIRILIDGELDHWALHGLRTARRGT